MIVDQLTYHKEGYKGKPSCLIYVPLIVAKVGGDHPERPGHHCKTSLFCYLTGRERRGPPPDLYGACWPWWHTFPAMEASCVPVFAGRK